ncbi:MAG: hypothetical protein AMJ68_08490 [Acidithiobacillales bacterium SG8_45]|nr:MAG: hypothetical protein AMJ68_08490 [Acidithiobacillales bacterium SG8_45]
MSDIRLATSPFGNFVVHAAAGTGKTWLLTSRIIRLLLAGAEPGAILAITFTRKAAAEIYERLLSRLLRLAGADEPEIEQLLREIGADTDLPTRRLARQLYEGVLTADQPIRISTFHAFCQELLQRFPLESGLPPGFQLIETTTELEHLAWQSLETGIRLHEDSPLARSMDTFLRLTGSPNVARTALMQFLGQRSDWWAFTAGYADPVAYAHEYAASLLPVASETPETSEAARTALVDLLIRYARELGKHPIKTNLASIARIEQATLHPGPVDNLLSLQPGLFVGSNGKYKPIKPSATLEKKLGAGGVTELIALHENIADRLDQWQQQRLAQRNLERNTAWFTCGQALLDKFQEIKLRRGQLDFSDLEWRAYKLLTDADQAQWVQYKLDQRIDHLLVDEFQDTNPTQWHLLHPLLDEMAAGQADRHRSAFIVGDIKQSIYRFRRAAPDLFHHARNWLTLHMGAEAASQQKSYRSSPAIIEFVNLLFDATDAQDDSHYHLHDFTTHEAHHRNRWGRVEILPLVERNTDAPATMETGFRNPLLAPRNQRAGTTEQQHLTEATIIADRIRTLVGEPIVADDVVRPMRFGDIMILLRSRTHAAIYENALRQADIPFSGIGKDRFNQSIEVQDIVSVLRALLAPFDNLALAAALRSPVFSCSNEDLAALAVGEPRWWRHQLAGLQGSLADSHPLSRAHRLLTVWQQLVDRIPVHDLLDRIYADANIVERYLHAAPVYLRQRIEGNLNTLLEQALEIDGGRYPSLSRFVELIASPGADDISVSPPASEDRVRIMTIHGAKGLEAPAVFVADAARQASEPPSSYRAVVDWPSTSDTPEHFLLVGKAAERDPVSTRLISKQKEADRKEEANLLYVALTRAGQYLFISGCEPKNGSTGWYGFVRSRLDAERESLAQGRSNFDIRYRETDEADNADPVLVFAYGEPESCSLAQDRQTVNELEIDSRLSQPIPASPSLSIINPSSVDEELPVHGPGAGIRARGRGIWIHRALEMLATDCQRDQVYQQFSREAEVELESDVIEHYWQEAVGIVDDERFSAFFNRSMFVEYFNEMPLLYFRGNDPVYGIVDRVVLTGESIAILDYKTHEAATPENINELARSYYSQMQFYGDGVAALWPQKKISLILVFTACSEIVEVPYPAET